MNWKKTISCLAGALAVCGCAKTSTVGLNEFEKAYFDSWMQINHPDLKPTSLGTYVLEHTPGTGAAVGDSEKNPYLRVRFTTANLDGTITSTNYVDVLKQLGTYSETEFHGPAMWFRGPTNMYANGLHAGLEDMLSDMKVGGRKTSIIPGWLFTHDRYDSPQGYLDNVSGTNAIYTLEVLETLSDVVKWENDSISRYLSQVYPWVTPKDTVKFGFYYVRTKEGGEPAKFKGDTTIYINYTGRLLNGQVFDTTVEDTAKFYGVYSAGKSYKPVSVSYKHEDYTETTLGSSTVIDGFSYAIKQMGPMEKGSAVFYSSLGYGASGSGSTIPGYSPLRFDIEVVEKQ